MKHYCYLTLRPTYWSQTLQHYSRIGVEGRRLFANCAVESGSDLDLSNGMKLDALPTYLSIYEPAQMQDELAKMPEGALGLFSFREVHEAEDDQPAQDAFLSGWLVLNAKSLQDTWDQVLHGDYTDCTIQIAISPVESSGGDWRWDVKRTPHLEIDTVELSFTRKAGRPEVIRRALHAACPPNISSSAASSWGKSAAR